MASRESTSEDISNDHILQCLVFFFSITAQLRIHKYTYIYVCMCAPVDICMLKQPKCMYVCKWCIYVYISTNSTYICMTRELHLRSWNGQSFIMLITCFSILNPDQCCPYRPMYAVVRSQRQPLRCRGGHMYVFIYVHCVIIIINQHQPI